MKFVIADASGTMCDILYGDLYGNEKYKIVNKERLFLLYRLFLSPKISILNGMKHIKRLFYKHIFKKEKNQGENTCFYLGIFWYDLDLFRFLKERYPRAKFVFNFHDTIESKKNIVKDFSIDFLKGYFDLIYTYNWDDAVKYNFHHVPDMYSKFPIEKIQKFPEYDVVFIGTAKDRLQMINDVYAKLTNIGLRCWFYVVTKNPFLVEHEKGIIYSNKYLSFEEVISRQYCAKALLEITQGGCEETTLRFWDSVMYNKKLITNCLGVKNYKYYDERYVLLFNTVEDINRDFFIDNSEVDFCYCNDISPITIFEIIEKDLLNNENC